MAGYCGNCCEPGVEAASKQQPGQGCGQSSFAEIQRQSVHAGPLPERARNVGRPYVAASDLIDSHAARKGD